MSMTTELAQRMKAAALNATPGRIGDRIDGTGSIKYQCFGNDGSLVLQTDHKNMEYGFIGPNSKADELFFRECSPENVLALVETLEARDKQIADSENRVGKQNRHICELFDDNTALRQRIIELEEKLETVDKLQDSAFRHGLQHGFSLGQTDNQAGFEQCMAAYSQKEKSNG